MKIYVFHGTKGSPDGNWFPWLKRAGATLGHEVVTPRLPTPEGHSLAAWLSAVDEQCGEISTDAILIGHSLGAVLCLRLLERLKSPVRGTILVAPPYRDIGIQEYDDLNASFFPEPFNWDSIKARAGAISLIVGDKDPYVPHDHFLIYSKGLDIPPIVVTSGGHLNSESGFVTFPLIKELLERIADEAKKN